MSYRRATKADFATGLTTQHALFEYGGALAAPAQTHVPAKSDEDALLSRPLWAWEGAGEPDYPPADTEIAHSYREWLEWEMESLRSRSLNETTLPANFLTVIWRHSAAIAKINEASPWHPLALISPSAHPANALRNAYAAAILADRICRRMGIAPHERASITSAALTMNWAIFQLQDKLSSVKSSLTPEYMHDIKAHPTDAAKLLRNMGLDNLTWLDAVEQHHEEPDGKGYPRHLHEEGTSIGGQILRACERFIALTSSRRFRQANLTGAALEAIETVVPDTHGIRSALLADVGPRPPGGYWLNPATARLWVSLGPSPQGTPMGMALHPFDSAVAAELSGHQEVSSPELSVAEHRISVERLAFVAPLLP